MNKGYLNGIYQAKTLSLLNNEALNELRNLNGKDFLNYLENINYNSLGSSYDLLDTCLESNIKEVRNELETLTNNNSFSDTLFFEIDLTNFKIVYKSVKENVKPERFIDSGKYSYDALYEFIANNNKSFIKKEDLNLFEKLEQLEEVNLKDSLEKIESIYFNYYYSLAKELDESLFIYLNFKRFVSNLHLLLKFKLDNKSDDLFNKLILEENIINKKEWEYIKNYDEKEIIEKFSLLYYGKLEAPIKNFFETNSLNKLDEALDNIFDDLMLEQSFKNKSLAPTVHYIYSKLSEQKKIRRAYYE